MMTLFDILLLTATFLTSLVAGFLFAFAVVAMPGIGRLDDRAFIRAFQVMDGVIQNNQPLFMLMWVGSVITLLLTAVWSIWQLTGTAQFLTIAAALIYLLGVQLPTARINIPLNNELQTWQVNAMSDSEVRAARERFEPRWNRWNGNRTGLAGISSLLLLIVLLLI